MGMRFFQLRISKYPWVQETDIYYLSAIIHEWDDLYEFGILGPKMDVAARLAPNDLASKLDKNFTH